MATTLPMTSIVMTSLIPEGTFEDNATENQTMPETDDFPEDGAIYFEILIILATYIYPIIVIGGVIFNSIALLVLLTSKMRKVSVNYYLISLAISDSLVLMLDFINNYFRQVLGINIISINDGLCAVYRFAFDASFTYSAWLIVIITVERFIVIYFPLKSKSWVSTKRSFYTILITFGLVCLYKVYNFFAWVVVDGHCDWKPEWESFHKFVNMPLTYAAYSYVPLIILISLNVAIIHKMWQSYRKRSKLTNESLTSEAETRKVTVTVLLISFTYMMLTIPLSAYYTIQYANSQFIEMTPQMALGEIIILLIGLCNHGINFFLYILSSRNFRQAAFNLITCHLRLFKSSETSSSEASSKPTMSTDSSPSISSSSPSTCHLPQTESPKSQEPC